MLSKILVKTADLCRKYAIFITFATLISCATLSAYIFQNISINTDINQLLSQKLAWRHNEKVLESAFPHKVDTIAIVIDGKTADKAESAAKQLSDKLSALPDQFPYVSRPDALPFFRTNGLMYLSKEELAQTLDQITQAQPMLGTVISDPSLRGLMSTLDMMAQGVLAKATDASQLDAPLKEIDNALTSALEGKEHSIDFNKMMNSQTQSPYASRELRRFIIAKPVLDFSALQPGAKATETIRQAMADLNLTPENGVNIRLTGSVPLNDEEFASVSEGTGLATALSVILVIGLLLMALKSWRIVIPITVTLIAGLIASTAFATFAVGSLNLISVAFAVMFIGIAVDFGIQFGVRYRDQRHKDNNHTKALRNTASKIALPLTAAAASTAIGFFAFMPTDYKGVSELGLIAGAGMIIAFALNITLLPALLTLFRPTPEPEDIGYKALTPLNDFLVTNSRKLSLTVLAIAVFSIWGASKIEFDFDPLNLKNPESESVSAMFDAMQDPDSDAYAAQILAPSEQAAQELAEKLSKLPSVHHTMTLNSFIPEEQTEKLAMISDTASLLEPTFSLPQMPPASNEDNLAAIRKTAALMEQIKDEIPSANKLAQTLKTLAETNSPKTLELSFKNVVSPLIYKMNEIRTLLQAKPVAQSDIPPELKKDWVTADGQWLVEAFPKRPADQNPRDPATLKSFTEEVYQIAPNASGTPVAIIESGKTVTSAFKSAGIYGFIAIALLSLVILKNPRDVAYMMAPIAMSAAMTLATATALGIKLNFANIIALPLLLSLGVSYSVYFAFYGKSGKLDFLQSSMARAVLFSAATVLVAFGSLCTSSHPGTQGMGKLLTIALLYSLISTFFILPILYGIKKTDKHR